MSGIFDNTDWVGISISSIIAGFIAWYFRFKSRPKIEIIYENNRNASFKYLFSNIQLLDDSFEGFYKYFENNVCELKKDLEEIIPQSSILHPIYSEDGIKTFYVDLPKRTQLTTDFEYAKDSIESTLNRIREHFKTFSNDYQTYHNYMEDEFLRDVSSYYNATINYLNFILLGYNYSTYLVTRKYCALKIIKYLENDELIDKTFPTIADFIKKWNDYEMDQVVFPHSSMFKQN